MKKILVTLIALGLFSAPSAVARRGGPLNIYAGVGLTLPAAGMEDWQKPGFQGVMRVGTRIAPSHEILIGFDFYSLARHWKSEDVEGGTLSVFTLMGDFKYNFVSQGTTDKIFFLLGAGYGRVSRADEIVPMYHYNGGYGYMAPGTITYEPVNGIGAELGVGIESGKFLFMAKYVSIITDGDPAVFVPITIGMKF